MIDTYFCLKVMIGLIFLFFFFDKVSSIASMPIWQFILKKFGKKSAFAAGMIVRNIAQTCKETKILYTCM